MNDLLPLSVCICVCLCMDVHVIEKQVWVRCRLIPPRASRLQHSSRRRGDSLPRGAQCSVTAEADVARLAVQVAQSRETSACLSERERDCCKSIKRRRNQGIKGREKVMTRRGRRCRESMREGERMTCFPDATPVNGRQIMGWEGDWK